MGQYTPRAFNGMMENPTSNRFKAAKKLIEAAGGKMISMYGMPAEGPGVMAIFETSNPTAATAISGVVVASGGLRNVKLLHLLTQEDLRRFGKRQASCEAHISPRPVSVTSWRPVKARGSFYVTHFKERWRSPAMSAYPVSLSEEYPQRHPIPRQMVS
jgi:uncharacterized protein with GYD domain